MCVRLSVCVCLCVYVSMYVGERFCVCIATFIQWCVCYTSVQCLCTFTVPDGDTMYSIVGDMIHAYMYRKLGTQIYIE